MSVQIQTAGEQKYYDFIQERAKTARTGMIVWISLVAVGFIAALSNIAIGAVLMLGGIFLAVLNLKSQKALKGKLDVVTDKIEFYNQLIAEDAIELKDIHVLITKDYVLRSYKDIFVYKISDMEKVEVGIQNQGYKQKVLFLTGKDGIRNEIASCGENDGLQESFDKAYRALNDKF